MAKTMMPRLQFTLSVTDDLYDSTRQARIWNAAARDALKEELELHHQQRIPLHFRLGAGSKYQYAPRTSGTKKKKRNYWRKPPELDLVRSGVTSRLAMSARQISFRGSFGSGRSAARGLTGRLTMWVPGYLRRRNKAGGIDFAQIAKEITATTDEEDTAIAIGFGRRFTRKMRQYTGGALRRKHKFTT